MYLARDEKIALRGSEQHRLRLANHRQDTVLAEFH